MIAEKNHTFLLRITAYSSSFVVQVLLWFVSFSLAGSAENDEDGDSTRPESSRSNNAESGDGGAASEQATCPLCSEKFPSQDRLESHAMSVHSVNSEGLQRLQSLINGSHWLNKKDQGNYNLCYSLAGFFKHFCTCIFAQKREMKLRFRVHFQVKITMRTRRNPTATAAREAIPLVIV